MISKKSQNSEEIYQPPMVVMLSEDEVEKIFQRILRLWQQETGVMYSELDKAKMRGAFCVNKDRKKILEVLHERTG